MGSEKARGCERVSKPNINVHLGLKLRCWEPELKRKSLLMEDDGIITLFLWGHYIFTLNNLMETNNSNNPTTHQTHLNNIRA
jgi:hypothetical protein